jgi:NAD-dependent protein deacetylase/lipoamidase
VQIDADTWVLVLTGAGVSAESGVPTFRGAGGLWEGRRAEDVATPQAFQSDPELVWRFYAQRRLKAAEVAPNAGHVALARLEQRLGDRFLLATQNVDGLHRRAGSRRLVELHGNLFTSRCDGCRRPPFADETAHASVPICDQCGTALRPHIVWFGEMLDPADMDRVSSFMVDAAAHRFLFLAVGTSGAVWPAAGFVDQARAAGAETWLVNLEPPENAGRFHHFERGKSAEILPRLFGAL